MKLLCLYFVQHLLHQIMAQQFYTDLDLYQEEFKDFSRPLSDFPVFHICDKYQNPLPWLICFLYVISNLSELYALNIRLSELMVGSLYSLFCCLFLLLQFKPVLVSSGIIWNICLSVPFRDLC